MFTVVFLVAGGWPFVRGGDPRWWSLMLAGAFMAITLAAPALLGPLNKLWLRFGLLLNRIVSPAALGIMFYAVVTPLGWLMRVCGKDDLRLRRNHAGGSYWIERDPPGPKPDSLNNQF